LKTILLAGGGGYIGTSMIKTFLAKGYTVKVIDNFIYNNFRPILGFTDNPDFYFYNRSMQDIKGNDPIFQDVDGVIVLGGLVGDPITKKYEELSKQINDVAVKRFITACSGTNVRRLLFISTCSNYGMLEDGQLATEETKLNPLSHYAKQKVEIEQFIQTHQENFTFDTTVLRFATAFGLSPRMRFDLTVNEFARALALGQPLEVYDADTWRPYCHVQDFSRLCEMVLLADSALVSKQTFNAGGDANNHTKRDVVERIKKIVSNSNINFVDSSNDPRNYRVSFKKVRETLNFEPKFDINFGIMEILKYADMKIFIDDKKDPNLFGNYSVGGQ